MMNNLIDTLYKLANSYASKNKIDDLPKEDYIQELVLYVWSKKDKYNKERASISTWAYMWFDSWRGNYFKTQKNSPRFISLNNRINEEEDEEFSDLIEDKNWRETLESLVFREIYNECNIYTRLWLTGLNYSEVANVLNCDKSTAYRNIKTNIEDIKEKYYKEF